MPVNFVENVGGRAQVRWPGAILLLAAALIACAVIPAGGFWLVFDDRKLVTTTLAVGFGIACLSCAAILGLSLRLPIERLPKRAEPNAAADGGA